MTDGFYRFGLLLLLFGGFLATDSTGTFAEWGIWLMVAGLGIGTVGILDPDARESESPR